MKTPQYVMQVSEKDMRIAYKNYLQLKAERLSVDEIMQDSTFRETLQNAFFGVPVKLARPIKIIVK